MEIPRGIRTTAFHVRDGTEQAGRQACRPFGARDGRVAQQAGRWWWAGEDGGGEEKEEELE
jgi:hypothetical protein